VTQLNILIVFQILLGVKFCLYVKITKFEHSE